LEGGVVLAGDGRRVVPRRLAPEAEGVRIIVLVLVLRRMHDADEGAAEQNGNELRSNAKNESRDALE
jgi:hypothetical protein